MTVITEEVALETAGEIDMIDITNHVTGALRRTNLRHGSVLVFVPGATGAVTCIEYEPGLKQDFPDALRRLFPADLVYKHHETWNDGNGHSHVRASFLGPSLTIPFRDGEMILGTWQQIVFLELDTRPRKRKLIVQVQGE